STMTWRGIMANVAALVVIAALSTLTPLADASVPDPSWIGGLYDDNDFDDVVDFATSTASSVDHAALRPRESSGPKVQQASEGLTAFFGRPAVCPRAPPAS